jgi:hypothetical protein
VWHKASSSTAVYQNNYVGIILADSGERVNILNKVTDMDFIFTEMTYSWHPRTTEPLMSE